MRVRHWDVEVARFRLDKSFDEDKSKICKGGAPVGTPFFRKPALNFITPISLRHADGERENRFHGWRTAPGLLDECVEHSAPGCGISFQLREEVAKGRPRKSRAISKLEGRLIKTHAKTVPINAVLYAFVLNQSRKPIDFQRIMWKNFHICRWLKTCGF